MHPNNGQPAPLTYTSNYVEGLSNALPSRVPTAQKEPSATLEILEAKALAKEMALDAQTAKGFRRLRANARSTSTSALVPLR